MSDDTKGYDPKLVHLPGSKLTAEVVLHRTLDKLERIKNIVVVIQWDNDTYAVDWSTMPLSSLLMASYALQTDAYEEMRANVEKNNGM